MKYKTLAVAVGSVILFAGCNDSLIFKRLEKTEEWLEAAEAKLKVTEAELESTEAELAALHESTEATLASMRSEKDQAQADLRKAERSIDSLTAKNVALAAYKNKRESADAEARRKEEESNRVEKLIGTWAAVSKDTRYVRIIRPRDFYGPLTASDLGVQYKSHGAVSARTAEKVTSIATCHIQIWTYYGSSNSDFLPLPTTTKKPALEPAFQVKLIDDDTLHYWAANTFSEPIILKRVGS